MTSHAAVAADGHVDHVAGLPAPELLVELLLARRPATPLTLDDQIAAAEAGGPGRARSSKPSTTTPARLAAV